jgi:hypothetical protein
VTYGLTPSAYLAQRVICQLVLDEGGRYPRASLALTKHIYVDDIVTGADSVQSAQLLQTQLIELLKLGGFQLI